MTYCLQRFFPPDRPLSGTLVGYICTREEGHPPPHRRGPKVYCGAIYPIGEDRYYCNLDLNHPPPHGREPIPATKPPNLWDRIRSYVT